MNLGWTPVGAIAASAGMPRREDRAAGLSAPVEWRDQDAIFQGSGF